MTAEERLEAFNRLLAGDAPKTIAYDLGRTKRGIQNIRDRARKAALEGHDPRVAILPQKPGRKRA